MIKKTLIPFLFIFTLCASIVKAQEGREWIVAGQPYYKIPVSEEAVYKISFTELNSNGISTSDPSKLQIWFRGVEQSIDIVNDTLYFYGKGNDGTLDSLLYEPYSAQSNKYYSLFSDTTYYFLTIGSLPGKRVSASVPFPTTVSSNHMHTETIFYADEYQQGTLYNAETHLSIGDVGEGWTSTPISQQGPTPVLSTINIPVSNLYTGGGNAQLEIMLVGANQNSHSVDILIGNPSSPVAIYNVPSVSFSARQTYKFSQSLPVSFFTNNQPLQITVRLNSVWNGSAYDPSMVALTYVVLSYPQVTNLTGKNFYFIEPVKDNAAKTLSLTNFTNGSLFWDITSEGAYVKLNYTYSSGTASADIAGSSTKILYTSAFKNVIGMKSVDMTPYPIGTGKMLLISHTKLLSVSNSAVLNYAAYRSSPAGGNISVAVTDVNKLYNLYTYGEKHPMAIKRYCKEEINNGTAKYLFLVGKGINYDYYGTTNVGDFYYRKNPEPFINNTHTYQQLNYRMEDFIPPYGWPASDLYYTITDMTLRPKLATGRLSARTDDEVDQYLEKAKANDALDSNVIWRKNLLHLSGGKNTAEVSYFRSVVDGFKAIVEGPRFGGKVVRTYTKNLTAGAVDTKLIYSVADEVNKGVSCITFFGHSSPSIIDLDIGNVSNPVYGYNNKGKYPLLLMNGCQSAEFFIMGSIPEDWIMTRNKGALLTLGHGDIGYPQYMKTYTEYMYKLNYTDNRFLNSSIGDIQKKTIDSFLTNLATDSNPQIVNAQATQFVLQGDPTVKIYKPQKTDYAIAGDNEAGEKKVYIEAIGTKPITAMSDAFNIQIPITNYGLSNPKNIQIQVKHTVTNNGTVTVNKVYPLQTQVPIGYVDTVPFTIQAKDPKYFGINKFEIKIDPNDSIKEFNENNNIATLEYFVPLSSVSCLYPAEYSVVYDQPVNFVAQAIDLFQSTKAYYIEIDTSHFFNSSVKFDTTMSSGALVKFTHKLLTDVLPSDSIVYYWRIRFNDLVSGEDTLWGESSFIYIKKSPEGWSQSKPAQFYKDTYNKMSIAPLGALTFNNNTAKLYARTQGNDNTNIEIGYNNNTLLAFIPGGYNCSYLDGCLIVVFDAETVLPYLANPSYKCGVYEDPQVQRFYDMTSTTTQNQVETFLKSIKKDEFVLFVSTGTTGADTWSSTLKNVFTNQFGAQHIPDLGSQTPYILLSRNRIGTTPLKEIFGTNPSDVITLDEASLLKGTYKSGSITSTVIGPSTLWGEFYKTVNLTNNDFAEFKIIRIDSLGNEVDIIDVPVALNDSIDLAPLVDAHSFPYIRLLMNTSDTTDFTPAYLKKWQVIYRPVPEGTMDPSKVNMASFPPASTDIGATYDVPFYFENISSIDFPDSLKVVFYIKNEFGKSIRETKTFPPLAKGQYFTFDYKINTSDFPGKNTFQAYVNPQFQPEVYYQNNFLVWNYNVISDKIHPVIGAMFDGIHIFDGDLVSPSPYITVTLKDNNGLLAMGDSTMTITLIDPNGVSTVIFKGGNSNYSVPYWAQDPSDKTRFRVEFKPKNDLADGKYRLIIQGKDASGNRSGNQNLEINFTVLNESTITNFYPYPNPFSTSCRFVFTLTGKNIPEDIKIQIMTVSGKVVREIFKNELGNIHVGDNITDYAWDGKDEFGDKLANGVYIYRVIIKNQNDKFDHRETSGDKAFKKGYGKLYILR